MSYMILSLLNASIVITLYFWAGKKFGSKHALAELLLKKMPQEWTGNNRKLECSSQDLLSEIEIKDSIHQYKIHIMENYISIWILFSILIAISSVYTYGVSKEITFIERPEYGENKKTVRLQADLHNSQVAISEPTEISLRPKPLTNAKSRELINDLMLRLPEIIEADNKSLDKVRTALNLIQKDPVTGIEIKWESSNPNIVREDGFVDSLAVNNTTEVSITAMVSLGDSERQRRFSIIVLENRDSDYIKSLFRAKVSEMAAQINDSENAERVNLPKKYGNEVSIIWHSNNSGLCTELLLGGILMLFMIYIQRYAAIKKQSKSRRDAIIREFPNFINKFVLLLNAGLVVSSALKKISLDYECCRNSKSKNKGYNKKPLYEDLLKIQDRIHSTHAPLAGELRKYAERSGIRELMRFSAIVSDNLEKGSSLADKLEAEGGLLWHNRKKAAEELGRLAETKLVLPLMLLLMVLIILTISPVLITMK